MGAAFGDTFTLTLLTDDPLLARQADRAGVQRIGVDLETLGKAARQRGHDTRISSHDWDDLGVIAGSIRRASLAFSRVTYSRTNFATSRPKPSPHVMLAPR